MTAPPAEAAVAAQRGGYEIDLRLSGEGSGDARRRPLTPARAPRNAIELEGLRILTTLGHGLRWQRAILHAAGLPTPKPIARLEPGAIGRLILQQVAPMAQARGERGREHVAAARNP